MEPKKVSQKRAGFKLLDSIVLILIGILIGVIGYYSFLAYNGIITGNVWNPVVIGAEVVKSQPPTTITEDYVRGVLANIRARQGRLREKIDYCETGIRDSKVIYNNLRRGGFLPDSKECQSYLAKVERLEKEIIPRKKNSELLSTQDFKLQEVLSKMIEGRALELEDSGSLAEAESALSKVSAEDFLKEDPNVIPDSNWNGKENPDDFMKVNK